MNENVKETNGDLLQLADEGHFDAIIHGINTKKVFGGFAGVIMKKYPALIDADRDFHEYNKGLRDEDKIGHYSMISDFDLKGQKLDVINLYTQVQPGPDFRLGAFRESLVAMHSGIIQDKLTYHIGMPWIGCGIGFNEELYDSVDTLKNSIRLILQNFCREYSGVTFTIVNYVEG